MYRILHEHQQVQERRNQLRHPPADKPVLLATAPNQLWSWDGRPFGRLVNIS
jgi:putative transposase